MLTPDELTIDSFASDLGVYLEPEQIDQVVKAYHFADNAHKGQKRKSGEPYITHPLAVANILAEMHMDHQCLMAALLHDVIEDTSIPKHTLGQEFDHEVAELVDGVSKLKSMFHSRAEAQAENFQKMTLAMDRSWPRAYALPPQWEKSSSSMAARIEGRIFVTAATSSRDLPARSRATRSISPTDMALRPGAAVTRRV